MESVVAFSALAAGIMIGLGALGAGVGIGILGSKLPIIAIAFAALMMFANPFIGQLAG